MRRIFPALALAIAGCSSERFDRLEAKVAELSGESERLARDLADLRKGGAAGAATAAVGTGSREAEAMARAVLEALAGTLPEVPTAAELPGVWAVRDGDAPLAVHYRAGGQLCGWRQLPGAARERAPFWGRWERHGRLVVEVVDRWAGDHNDHDVVVRTIDTLDAQNLSVSGDAPRRLTRVPRDAWRPLASLYADREAPIPGLPVDCFAQD